MAVRKIPRSLVSKIILEPSRILYDVREDNLVALGAAYYAGKTRWFAVPHKKSAEFFVITVYPISEQQINSRITLGRWRDEKLQL